MSILVACQCGKRFKTSDANAGKRAKCPGCGTTLTIPTTGVKIAPTPAREEPAGFDDLMSLAGPAEVFQPSASAAPAGRSAITSPKVPSAAAIPPLSKSKRSTGPAAVPRITLSPMVVILIVLAILIPSLIFWAKEGPMKAYQEWKQISETGESNIAGQVQRALEHHFKSQAIDLSELKYRPKASNVFFDEPAMMLRLPETIHFQGSSTEGNFHGVFHPHTMKFEADIPIQNSTHHLTGSASDKDQSLEMDGTSIN